ncbi:hypothetical protein EI77_03648 [Prosthecobacter fusiformis]|uniref:Uncharacterized protein n=1 Tax=Prosthecobacter fusiformis TaxID=48464 RepID=A0A4V3FED0_9BACT|nr:hypothetical protein EI77_03648 [Prosthecobacter fusiformis]
MREHTVGRVCSALEGLAITKRVLAELPAFFGGTLFLPVRFCLNDEGSGDSPLQRMAGNPARWMVSETTWNAPDTPALRILAGVYREEFLANILGTGIASG